MIADDRGTIFMLGSIALYSGGPAIIAFVILYGFRSPWRRLRVGRALMYMAVSLAVVYLLLAVTIWLGQGWPGQSWARLIVYVSVSAAMWWMLATLISTQSGRGPSHLEDSSADDSTALRRKDR